MVRTKHEITQSRTAFPPSPGQVEWTFLDLCCFTHSRRFSTLIPNQQLSRCEAAAGWCWPVYLGPVRCDAVFHTPAGSVSPLSSPLLIPSWLRLRRSPEVVHLLRPKAPASMTCCYPDNVIDAAAGPKSYQADDTRRMTKRCLSSAVTAPRALHTQTQIDQNDPICLCHRQLFCLFTPDYSRHVLPRKSQTMLNSLPRILYFQWLIKICLSKFFCWILNDSRKNEIEKWQTYFLQTCIREMFDIYCLLHSSLFYKLC